MKNYNKVNIENVIIFNIYYFDFKDGNGVVQISFDGDIFWLIENNLRQCGVNFPSDFNGILFEKK